MAESASSGKIIKRILMLITLMIDIYILVTTLNMQKPEYQCKCAQKWYLKQISNSIITILSLQIAIFVLVLFKNVLFSRTVTKNLIEFIAIALAFVQLYYTIVMISLIYKLDKDKCQCVDPRFKSVVTFYSGFRALLTIMMIFIIAVGIHNKK
jgi:hypothetical protein